MHPCRPSATRNVAAVVPKMSENASRKVLRKIAPESEVAVQNTISLVRNSRSLELAMEAVTKFLQRIQPKFLKDYIFVVLVLLYAFGPLEFVASFIATIWSLPSIFIVSGFVWRAIEARLSKECVDSDGKAIFISGCDSGFGFKIAKRMAGKG